MAKGRIFNIQRFSIHDGPGIRTIVFFKGCYMRCAWCSNPESQRYEIEKMVEGGREKIVGRDVTVDEIMPELLSDLTYYRRSGGGITLSGGEVTAQPEFACELLRACRQPNLNTLFSPCVLFFFFGHAWQLACFLIIVPQPGMKPRPWL